jgi:hypothetical protein
VFRCFGASRCARGCPCPVWPQDSPVAATCGEGSRALPNGCASGDLRSVVRRGQETCAERDLRGATRSGDLRRARPAPSATKTPNYRSRALRARGLRVPFSRCRSIVVVLGAIRRHHHQRIVRSSAIRHHACRLMRAHVDARPRAPESRKSYEVRSLHRGPLSPILAIQASKPKESMRSAVMRRYDSRASLRFRNGARRVRLRRILPVK